MAVEDLNSKRSIPKGYIQPAFLLIFNSKCYIKVLEVLNFRIRIFVKYLFLVSLTILRQLITTRKINFREGRNPSLNYHNSLTNEFSDGLCDDR